jgi:hypothetical protein
MVYFMDEMPHATHWEKRDVILCVDGGPWDS